MTEVKGPKIGRLDIAKIRAAAENYPSPWPMSLQPNTVLALCDEIEKRDAVLRMALDVIGGYTKAEDDAIKAIKDVIE